MADRSMSLPMTLSDPERQDARGQVFRRIFLTLVTFDLERPNSAGKQRWGGAYRGQPRPYRKGSPPNFGGSFYLCMHPLTQNYLCTFTLPLPNLTWKHMGRGLFLGVSHALSQGGMVPVLPNFRGSVLFVRTLSVAELPNFTW